jgi:urease accessory protein
MRRHARPFLYPALILLLPTAAQAHVGGSDAGLIDGLMHPVFGLDHLLAMISVGIVSAQLAGNNFWRVPLAFLSAMTVGATLGILRIALPNPELGIAVSVVVLGIAIALAHPGLSPWPITALVLFFGVFHGYAHGREMPASVSPQLYALGFLISTAMLHIFGVIIGEVATMKKWLWNGLRVTGGAVSAAGAAVLLQTLAGTA